MIVRRDRNYSQLRISDKINILISSTYYVTELELHCMEKHAKCQSTTHAKLKETYPKTWISFVKKL